MLKVRAQAVLEVRGGGAKMPSISTLSTALFVRFLTRFCLSRVFAQHILVFCEFFYKANVRFLTGWGGQLNTVYTGTIKTITN